MTEARLIIEGYDEVDGGTLQEDWGVYRFASVPTAGDIVRVGHNQQSRDVKVSRVIHLPAADASGVEPIVYVIGEY